MVAGHFFFIGLVFASPAARAQVLTIQGKVADSNNAPVSGGATKFRVQIYLPDPAKHCVVYDETHTLNLSTSGGLFSLDLGDVNPASISRDLPNNLSLEEALSNRRAFDVTGTYCSPVVPGTAHYLPNETDIRKVVIQFNDSATMGSHWETIPEMNLNPAAYAMDSRTVGGFHVKSLLRVVDTGGDPLDVNAFSAADATELARLAAGTSNKYVAKGGAAGVQLPSGAPATPAAGSIWLDGANLKYSDGINPPYTIGTGGGGGGTITEVAAGAGLTGGGTSGTVTIALPASGVGVGSTKGSATAVPRITYDTYGRITGVSEEAITGTLPGAGASAQVLKSDGTNWGAAYIRMGDIRSSPSNTSVFPATMCTASETMYWNSGTDKFACQSIALGAPAVAVAASYKLVTVAADGRVNGGSSPTDLDGFGITDALKNTNGVSTVEAGSDTGKGSSPSVDGRLYIATDTKKVYRSGAGAWAEILSAAGSGGTITDVKVDANLSRSVSGTEITVGLPNKGTADTYYKVTTDAQGRVVSGSTALVAGDIPSLDWSKITGTPTSLSAYGIAKNYVENSGSALSLAAGNTAARPGTPYAAGRIYIDTQVNAVYYDTGAGWQTIAAAGGFTGSLGGEVSGTQGSTQVDSINGFNRTAITTHLTSVSNATDAATNSTIVKRDGSGGFAATEIRLKDGTTHTVGLKAAGTSATYSLELPAAAPAAGQSLQSDASGVLSWVTAAAGSLTNILQGTGISVTGTGATRTVTLADTAVAPNSYGSATKVPSFTVDQQGRLTAAADITIAGTAPGGAATGDLADNYPNPTVAKIRNVSVSSTAPGVGQVLKYVSSNWAASTLDLNDLKQNDNTTSAMANAGVADCTASKVMYYDTSTKSLRCQNASIAAATQITGLLPVANGGTGVNATSITQNYVFAAPSSGAGAPSFRALTSSDLPGGSNPWDTVTGGINYAGGSVGIGTTNPASKLHIAGIAPTVRLQDNAGGAAAVSRTMPGLELVQGTLNLSNPYTPSIKFMSNDPDLTTESPKLLAAILGRATQAYTADTSGGMALDFATSPNSPGANNVPITRMTIDQAGNVGIGTTNPSVALEVVGAQRQSRYGTNTFQGYYRSGGTIGTPAAVADTDMLGQIAFGGNSGSSDIFGAKIEAIVNGTVTGTSVPTDLLFRAGNTSTASERMRIKSDGNVGIGTTNPSAKLDVIGNINFGQRQNGGAQPGYLSNYWNGSVFSFATLGSSFYDGSNWITNSGAAFGSNNVSTISVDPAGIRFLTLPATGNTQLTTAAATFSTYERMRIDTTTGNVGIGTTAPNTLLDVAGTSSTNASSEGMAAYTNSSTAYTIPDASLNIRRITLTGNATITLPAYAPTTSKMYTLTVFLKQDGTGSRTVSFAGNGSDTIKWDSGTMAAISTAAAKITIVQFTKPSDETVWYASQVWKEN